MLRLIGPSLALPHISTSPSLLDPMMEYLTHKGNDREDHAQPQQAIWKDQEFQLYNFKVLCDGLYVQQLGKYLPPIL